MQNETVSEINSNLKPQLSKLALNGYSAGTTTNAIIKIGKIVTINAILVRNDGYSIPAGEIIAYVPDGYRPPYSIYRIIATVRGTASGMITWTALTIGSNGAIYTDYAITFPSSSVYNELYVNVTYFVS